MDTNASVSSAFFMADKADRRYWPGLVLAVANPFAPEPPRKERPSPESVRARGKPVALRICCGLSPDTHEKACGVAIRRNLSSARCRRIGTSSARASRVPSAAYPTRITCTMTPRPESALPRRCCRHHVCRRRVRNIRTRRPTRSDYPSHHVCAARRSKAMSTIMSSWPPTRWR